MYQIRPSFRIGSYGSRGGTSNNLPTSDLYFSTNGLNGTWYTNASPATVVANQGSFTVPTGTTITTNFTLPSFPQGATVNGSLTINNQVPITTVPSVQNSASTSALQPSSGTVSNGTLFLPGNGMKLWLVANRTDVPQQWPIITGGSNILSRVDYSTPVSSGAQNIQLVYANWFFCGGAGALGYFNPEIVNNSATVTFYVTLEYPAGVSHPITWGGLANCVMAPGAMAVSDSLPVYIPPNSTFWLRETVTNTSQIYPAYVCHDTHGYPKQRSQTNGWWYRDAAGNDATNMAYNPPDVTTNCFGPIAILGQPTGVAVPKAIVLFGDSRVEQAAASGFDGPGKAYGGRSAIAESLDGVIPEMVVAAVGASLNCFTYDTNLLFWASQWANIAYWQIGNNDCASLANTSLYTWTSSPLSNATVAPLITNMLWAASTTVINGMVTYIATVTGNMTQPSNPQNNCITNLADQAIFPGAGQIVQSCYQSNLWLYDMWLRSNAVAATGAQAIITNADALLYYPGTANPSQEAWWSWYGSGTSCDDAYTYDGIHESSIGATQEANAFLSNYISWFNPNLWLAVTNSPHAGYKLYSDGQGNAYWAP